MDPPKPKFGTKYGQTVIQVLTEEVKLSTHKNATFSSHDV